MTCIGVFQAYYATHQLRDYPASTIGWIPLAETFLLFLGVPVFGGLSDRLGPTVILVVGTVLHVGGLLGLASCETYGQIFAAQSIVSAMGTGAGTDRRRHLVPRPEGSRPRHRQRRERPGRRNWHRRHPRLVQPHRLRVGHPRHSADLPRLAGPGYRYRVAPALASRDVSPALSTVETRTGLAATARACPSSCHGVLLLLLGRVYSLQLSCG